jgi:hypothetical protein
VTNLILSPALLVGLLLAIVCLLILVAYFTAAAKRRLDAIIRQQQEMIALLTGARNREREVELERTRPIRSRAEPKLMDEGDEGESRGRIKPAADLVARR